jgi:hypothetical protein
VSFRNELATRNAGLVYKVAADDFTIKMSKQCVCVVMDIHTSTDMQSIWPDHDPW